MQIQLIIKPLKLNNIIKESSHITMIKYQHHTTMITHQHHTNMLTYQLTFAIFIFTLSLANCQKCPSAQYIQFIQKQIDIQFPTISNPYHNPTSQYLQNVTHNLKDKEQVCALHYTDSSKKKYSLMNFPSKEQAQSNGWIVTHQGKCGKCSTMKDLYVYLTTDLTRPVRKCGIKHFHSHQRLFNCIKSLGFTDPCTQVWLWNTINTKKHCGLVCMWSLLTHQPFVKKGHLNQCLQCDQDISGPIFKYQSGRTRRNSGIKSEIDRPDDQVYNLTHCYY